MSDVNEVRTNMNEVKRELWLDIAKAIAILGVIILHSTQGSDLCVFFSSFGIPLFFIASGYTIKPVEATGAKSDIIKAYLKALGKDALRLMVPYFLVSFAAVVINIISNPDAISDLLSSIVNIFVSPTVGIVWFLGALFWGRAIYRILLMLTDDRPLLRGILSLLICVFGVWIAKISYLPQALDVALVVVLLLEIGYGIKKYGFVSTSEKEWVFTISGIVAFVLWLYFTYEQNSIIDLAMRQYSVYGFISALSGCVFFIMLCKALEQFGEYGFCAWGIKLLSFLGKHTLEILVVHCFDLFWMGKILPGIGEGVRFSLVRCVVDCIIAAMLSIVIKNCKKIILKK